MAFSVTDKATDAAVRKLARLKNRTLTAAIREAAENEIRRLAQAIPLSDRLPILAERHAACPKTGERADKAFHDDLGGGL